MNYSYPNGRKLDKIAKQLEKALTTEEIEQFSGLMQDISKQLDRNLVAMDKLLKALGPKGAIPAPTESCGLDMWRTLPEIEGELIRQIPNSKHNDKQDMIEFGNGLFVKLSRHSGVHIGTAPTVGYVMYGGLHMDVWSYSHKGTEAVPEKRISAIVVRTLKDAVHSLKIWASSVSVDIEDKQ